MPSHGLTKCFLCHSHGVQVTADWEDFAHSIAHLASREANTAYDGS